MEPTRSAIRFLTAGMALMGFGTMCVALVLYAWHANTTHAARERQVYYLVACELAAESAADLAILREKLVESGRIDGGFAGQDGVTERLASSRISIEALSDQLQLRKDPVVAAVRLALAERFDRLVAALASSRSAPEEADPAELRTLLSSVSLAVGQIGSLNDIALRQLTSEASEAAVERVRAIVLIGVAVVGLAILAGWKLRQHLFQSLAREDEARSTIEQARIQQQRTFKMEALGRLAGGVAHDFNNLLTVVLASSETIERRLAKASPLRTEIHTILQAVERAAELTRQLLSLGGSKNGGSTVVDLNEMTQEMELLLQRLAGPQCTLPTYLEPQLEKVKVNRSEMERVLLNLVSNAGDSMSNGGTITIETANTQTKGETHLVRLSVSDMGSGMDDESREHAFEPFFTTKEPGEGTGLGLATVHGIVARYGGSIEIESELGIGTRVDVYLPSIVADPNGDAEPESSGSARGGTILLAEDERAVRGGVARSLRAGGYEVIETENGREALEFCAARREPIDLILTDVMMPEMTGPEMVDRAKSFHPEARILFISGDAGAEIPPSTHFLAKPIRGGELLNCVRELLNH